MAQGIVYIIINKETGHKYLNATTLSMNKEWQNHIQASNRMSTELIHRAFRQYGLHKFMIKQIDECDEKILEDKVTYWFEQYKPEYNDPLPKKKPPEPEPIIIEEPIPVIKEKKSTWRQIKPEERSTGKCLSIRVQGTHIETGEVKEWENARAAALEITGDKKRNSNLLNAAKKGNTYYGYRWKVLDTKTHKRSVKGVHKVTHVEIRYESISEAIRQIGDGSNGSGLLKSLRNPNKYTYKGFLWYYD
jgi:hypothetical protein